MLIKLFSFFALLSSCAQLKQMGFQGVKQQRSAFRVVWSKNLDTISNTGNLPIALGGPFIHKDLIYIGDNAGHMKAYNLQTGRLIWSVKEKTSYNASPIVSGDKLLYGDTDGRFYARHHLTGELIYAVDLGASIESRAVVQGGRVFLHTRNHQIFALDFATGKILWFYKKSIPQVITIQGASHPLIYRDKLFIGFADGTLCSFSLEEGSLLWERRIAEGTKFIDVDMAPVAFNNRLYIGTLSNNLHVFSGETGTLLRVIKDKVYHSPTIVDEHLIYLNDRGEIVALDQSDREVVRTNISPNDSLVDIKQWKGGLIVSSTTGHLYFLDKKTFQVLEKQYLGHAHSAIFGPIQVKGNTMAVFSSRNRLYVYR